jgi:CRP/FNR family transcriptional regulator, cyclic AMP receptor protein
MRVDGACILKTLASDWEECRISRSAETSNDAVLASPWALGLSPELKRRVARETVVRSIESGGFVCRKGEPASDWIGVMRGLVKVYGLNAEGKSTTFIGVPTGGWFGEGALLKNERRLYDAVALRPSEIAYVPRATFRLLSESSVGFNRFLLDQLNERLGQFVALVEHNRLVGPEARLANELAALFNSRLYPGLENELHISQEELAQLVGLSRQRVNRALKVLASAGLVTVAYERITVVDLGGLRKYAG